MYMKKILSLCLLFCINFVLVRAQAPTTPASNVTFNSFDGNGYRVTWTNGNGARRIVVMREGAPVTALPVNGIDYNHNTIFGSGDLLAPGQFVIQDGFGSLVDVSGLQPATTYHVAIFEYNGTASATQYLTASFATGSQATLSAPTTAASAPLITNIAGSSMTISWTNGNGGRRIVVGRAGGPVNANPSDLTFYNSNPVFGSAGTQLGTGNYILFNGTGNTVTTTGLQPNTAHHFSIFEFNGTGGAVYLIPGTTVNATTAPRPSVAASNAAFSSLEGNGMRFTWTNGNGNRRIVVARAGSAVTAVPVDGVDYTANSVFGSGDDLGGNQYVVSDGLNSLVDVSGLSHSTVYHFRVYEYDGTGATTAYLTSSFLAASQSTLLPPTIQASNISFTNISGSTVTINWTNGNGGRRMVVGRAGGPVNTDPVNNTFYSANAVFGSAGSQLGTGNFVVFNSNSGNSVVVTGLAINTTYHFSIFEFNGIGGAVYLLPGAIANVTTPAAPTVPASAMTFSSFEGNAFRAAWTSGNGARRIVVARQGSAVTAVPVDGIDYTANVAFGSGDDLGGNQYVVFDGTASFVDLTNLQAANTYHFRVYEYNGTGATTSYLTASFASGSQATLSPPTIQASNISFINISGSTVTINWTNGNGGRRIVVGRAGGPVNTDPVNNTFYSANTAFGTAGSQLGTGNFVVFNSNSGNSVSVTGLAINTIYHFSIFEFNGISGTVYLVPGATGSFTTAGQPTVPASAMTFSSIDGNAMRVSWTNGNGARRIVVARAGSAVTATPVNGVDYAASNVFGSGSNLGSNQFVVFDGTSTLVDMSNLVPNTVYHYAVFEYDATAVDTAYLTSSFLAGSQSTISPPTVQASNVSFSAVAGTSVTVGWTLGNGSARLVVARQGSPVNANPADLTVYSTSTVFGSGAQVGVGNYVIYSSTGSSTGVTGLATGTTYHFAVYEYNGSSGRVYLVPGATGSFTTLGPPQVQATSVSASLITTNTLQLTWTNGSGNRRLVLMRQSGAVNAAPVDNGTYTANSAFGAGTQVGTGNYVVFNGTSNVVLVTGLTPNTTYHFAVYEFNSFGATSQFLLTNPAIGSAMTTGALPLTWLSFTGKNLKNRIELKWTTTAERNASHFEVQRNGLNDQNSFHAIGTVPASGGGNVNAYSFIDESPLAGMNYYRVKQYDHDNRFSYSMIIAVKYEPQGLIKRFLNPVDERGIFVELTAFDPNMNTRNEWLLYNMSGAIVVREMITSSVIYGNSLHIPAGMYVLEIRANGKTERLKIIKH
jgi:hypothetical protein